jgi:hypothetical protein
MFEITDEQKNILANFLSSQKCTTTAVFFDNERISFKTSTLYYGTKTEQEITIYANGQTQVKKSEAYYPSTNTTKPIETNEFY